MLAPSGLDQGVPMQPAPLGAPGRRSMPIDEAVLGEFSLHTLRECALLADGKRGALIGPRGDVSWVSAQSWHSDAIFSILIGGDGATR